MPAVKSITINMENMCKRDDYVYEKCHMYLVKTFNDCKYYIMLYVAHEVFVLFNPDDRTITYTYKETEFVRTNYEVIADITDKVSISVDMNNNASKE